MKNDLSSNHILAAIDFSPDSTAALAFAAALSDRLRARLTVLHVIHDSVASPGYYSRNAEADQLRTIEELARARFDEFMEEMRGEHPLLHALVNADTLLYSGIPVPRILEVVEKLNPDMVVMGSQGRTGLSHVLLGSKAEKVAQLCPAPVTIVKRKNPRDVEQEAGEDK